MRDPLGPCPPTLAALVAPLTAPPWKLQTFPLHAHEVLFGFTVYSIISYITSPFLCSYFLASSYPKFPRRTRINWDLHVTSFVQSVLICTTALWVLLNDDEVIGDGTWRGRIWGYSGAAGMTQALAAGYFLWDVVMCTLYFDVQGIGALMHGISALVITMMGFRPFANYYGLAFIFYELSTPFLNIHWFLDKLGMTGSTLQLYNGIFLLATFGLCRLVWGTYQSFNIYSDLWKAVQSLDTGSSSAGDLAKKAMQDESLPVVVASVYLVSNTILLVLNFHWFGKMIEAVRKRFVKPSEKKR